MRAAFLICLINVLCAFALPPLPNIGYLGAGYNIMKGNPHATNPEQGVDPGFSAFVFNLAIYNNTATPDNKYEVPFGVDVLMCDFCSIETQSETIAGSSSYEATLSKEIDGKVGAFGASFSASYDYKTVTNRSSEYKDVFMETKAECCAYKSQISQFLPPPMSAEFTSAIKTLPLQYNEAAYMKVLSYFGTHAVTNMMMGGRFGMRSQFSSRSWSQMESSTINTKVSAGFSLFSYTAAANAMSSTDKKMASNYQRFVNNSQLFFIGGQITPDGSVSSWAVTAAANPMPLTIQVVPLPDLITPLHFPGWDPKTLSSIQAAMQTALNSYCPWLKAQGLVLQCTAPGPDPPTPAGSIFAGFYQADDCGKGNIPNSFTNAMSCPVGSVSHQIGRVLSPESNCGASQYVCLMSGMSSDPLNNYGGSYQHADVSQINSYPNPLTGGFTCPAGYTAVTMGRVYAPESKSGAGQFACIIPSRIPVYETTGGFYQNTDGEAADIVNNPFTNAASCPPNYCAVSRGRTRAPESKTKAGATQHACINCNLVNLW